jgi:hypothetical protein
VLLQLTVVQRAADEAAWRQQVDLVHQQILDQQKHKAALRQRLQQDAQRAKREQLRRVEPVAKARARANGLASLGLDPEIMGLSEKFGKLSGLVDEVQQRMEAQYGSMASWDDAAAYGQLPMSPAATGGAGLGPGSARVGPAARQQQALQAAPRQGARQQQQQAQRQQQQELLVQQPRQQVPVQQVRPQVPMQQQAAAGWPVSQPANVAGPHGPYFATPSMPGQQYSTSPLQQHSRQHHYQQPCQQVSAAQQPPQAWQQPVWQEQQQQQPPPAAAAQPGPQRPS